ncbi:hypothetical protein [Streptomyces spinosus]|uniref:hypothetical protein n=1 Tax=Streptomyces spinosus TaxID=2872623 RepID=UPI0035566AC6
MAIHLTTRSRILVQGMTGAESVLAAVDRIRPAKPLVVRLDGNNAARGRAILDARAHPLVEQVATMDGAARRAAELAHTV